MGAGEGTRGGQVIGHTSSGKPIYASHLNSTGKMVHGAAAAPGGAAPSGPYRVTHGSDGNPVGAKPGAGQKFTQLAAKANNASYDARGGSQAQHTAAAKAHRAAAGAAQGTIYAAQAHVHAAAAEAHEAAAKEAGQKGTAWAPPPGTIR